MLVAAACVSPGRVEPTPTFPTAIAIPSPEPTPRLTGACSLLLEVDVEEVTRVDVEQVSATPLTCGFANGASTIALTLQRAASWDEFVASFEIAGPVEAVAGLGDRAVFAADTLDGVLIVAAEPELYILSGTGDRATAERLMARILARFAESEDAESLD
jgi:hypothetical protein